MAPQQVAWVFFEEDFLHTQLVLGVHHGIGEEDHQRLRSGIHELADPQANVVLVELQERPAEVVDALAHLADHGDGHDRIGTPGVRNVHLLCFGQAFAIAAGAGQRDGALEAGGDEHADARAFALDQRVGAERGGVADGIHRSKEVGHLDAELLAGVGERGVEAERQIMMCRESLACHLLALPGDKAVGESAADVNGNAIHRRDSSIIGR